MYRIRLLNLAHRTSKITLPEAPKFTYLFYRSNSVCMSLYQTSLCTFFHFFMALSLKKVKKFDLK